MSMNDFQISRHFNLQEFASPDTDEVKIDTRVGLAVDMVPKGLSLRKLFIRATKIKGVGGLGWYEDSHIHIDIRKDRLYWVKLKGKPIKYFEHFVGAVSYYSAKTMAKITFGGT